MGGGGDAVFEGTTPPAFPSFLHDGVGRGSPVGLVVHLSDNPSIRRSRDIATCRDSHPRGRPEFRAMAEHTPWSVIGFDVPRSETDSTDRITRVLPSNHEYIADAMPLHPRGCPQFHGTQTHTTTCSSFRPPATNQWVPTPGGVCNSTIVPRQNQWSEYEEVEIGKTCLTNSSKLTWHNVG